MLTGTKDFKSFQTKYSKEVPSLEWNEYLDIFANGFSNLEFQKPGLDQVGHTYLFRLMLLMINSERH